MLVYQRVCQTGSGDRNAPIALRAAEQFLGQRTPGLRGRPRSMKTCQKLWDYCGYGYLVGGVNHLETY